MTNPFNYTIDKYSLKDALLWGNCAEHWKKTQTGNLQGRVVHGSIALLESIPIIGQIASLIEFRIMKDLDQTTSIDTQLKIETNEAIQVSFKNFIQEFENEILPYYLEHEKTFDPASIHGRMHASRAMLFSEMMARYMISKGETVDIDLLRRVIGLHDAGRKRNGKDIWEKDSAQIIQQYLIDKGMPEEMAIEQSEMVVNKNEPNPSLEAILFSSGDCLDIMRPCTGRGGRKGFNQNFFLFLRGAEKNSADNLFRRALIEEAWIFIQETESKKNEFNQHGNSGYISQFLKVIEDNKQKYPLLNHLLDGI